MDRTALQCVCRLCHLQMLLEALILFTEPQQEQPLMLSACHSLADSLGICEQAGQQAKLQLGFEQHFRAGSFKGRVELQVLHTTQQTGKVFAGMWLPREGGLNPLAVVQPRPTPQRACLRYHSRSNTCHHRKPSMSTNSCRSA